MEFRWNKEWNVPTVTGIISFGAGAAVGYMGGLRKYKDLEKSVKKMEKQVKTNSKEVTDVVQRANRAWELVVQQRMDQLTGAVDGTTEDETTEEPEETFIPLVEHHPSAGMSEHILTPEEVPEMGTRHVIFPEEENDPNWNFAEEMKTRSSETPYVIHRTEYEQGEAGYSQSTLTYYAGDDILTDDHDVPIYNKEYLTGELKFGHGSEDPNIVYVRNERLDADYEVLLDHGYYQVEILGEEIENALNHEKDPPRKFRPTD